MWAMEAGTEFLETLSHLVHNFKTLWYMIFLVCNDIIKKFIFTYNVTENSPTFLARYSVFNGPNDLTFGIETCIWSYGPDHIMGNIDNNLLYHIFDDLI